MFMLSYYSENFVRPASVTAMLPSDVRPYCLGKFGGYSGLFDNAVLLGSSRALHYVSVVMTAIMTVSSQSYVTSLTA
jgi:hypothetical protein